MPTIREQFHTIGNWHNKITIAAGYLRAPLQDKSLASFSPEELKAKQEDLISTLKNIEKYTLSANEKITELKTYIYKTINPETEIK
jgi:hypothetical protein